MADAFPILVSTQWLVGNLEAADIAVLDASRHLPAANRNPRAEFEASHIPGARFLDLETLTDAGSSVPAALPTAEQVSRRLALLGVTPDHRIVLYDDSAVKTSARAWLALTSHGLEHVAILDGGLAKWKAEGHPLESGVSEYPAAAPVALHDGNDAATKAEMLANIGSKAEQVLDARAADRVFGRGIDPVHGGQNGRIPGSLNLPFGQVFTEGGTFKQPAVLRAEFEQAGVDMERPLVTTCGSGVTASVLLFAARLAGKEDVRLYDGSWQEWEADPATPKAQGPKDTTGS
ncbi:3-mercaptopyruvate sulfurtransferase [Erythrobacter sp. KY5]|uniref:sulfurtransferase n=1 Tax=Erythrobacter sp. KY5 TaxID=2011159 RepID=UPI000DBF1E83|nr:sulfurtransferase [Erythrobacter sp. KY5]AWW74026.1 3-mercaptopyruvate sulfurtransferase [Erythrobacter sp. KY5]